MIVAILASLLVAAAAAANVVELTADSFDAFVAAEHYTLVQVYAPWCGHCKAMKPAYEDAATTLVASGMRLGALDATANRALGDKLGVRGYPTIVRYRAGVRETPDYKGARTAAALVEHMRAEQPAKKDEL